MNDAKKITDGSKYVDIHVYEDEPEEIDPILETIDLDYADSFDRNFY